MATIFGTPGPDPLTGTPDADYIDGQGGADTMTGLAGDDTYVVDDPGDVIVEAVGEGSDRLYALSSYTLGIGVSIEELYTGGADPFAAIDLTGNEFGQNLYGNSGDNELDGAGGTDYLFGGAGNDVLTGGTSADFLWGEEGNDILDGGEGADRMAGGLGDDVFIADNALDRAVEFGGEGEDRVYALVDYALEGGSSIEILVAGGGDVFAAIDLTGNGLANNLWGNNGANILLGMAGDDALIGFGGNDYLDGGLGADLLAGGLGNDVYVVDQAGDVVAEFAGEGSDIVYALASFALASDAEIEQLFAGGPNPTAAIDLTGNDFANVIAGNGGANAIQGLGGTDTLFGYGGDDTISGGAGGDEIHGGDGNDVLYGEAAGVFGNDTLGDRLYGGAGNDILDASGGAPTTVANAVHERDQMYGGTGDDIYIVRQTNTTVFEEFGEGYDEMWLYASSGGGESIETFRIVGAGPINASGNQYDNYIDGNASANLLSGQGGNDVINGLGGADMIHGNAGADTFIFSTDLFDVFDDVPDTYASLRDFTPADDTIALDDALFTALSPGALPANAFTTGTVATAPEHRIIFDPFGGLLFYDANGSEPGEYFLFGHIYGYAPTANDFVVV